MRIVVDSSVVVAALVTPNPESASRILFRAVAAGTVDLVVTGELEAEYRRAVEYPQVRRYAPGGGRQAFVDAIVATAEHIAGLPTSARVPVPADPDDEKIVAAALGGGAEPIVTLDRDLLDMRSVGSVRILRPGDFLQVLRSRP